MNKKNLLDRVLKALHLHITCFGNLAVDEDDVLVCGLKNNAICDYIYGNEDTMLENILQSKCFCLDPFNADVYCNDVKIHNPFFGKSLEEVQILLDLREV